VWFVNLVEALAWPLVALYVVRTYQIEIAALFSRIRSASAFGLIIDSDDQQQAFEDAPEPEDNLKDLMAIPETQLLLEFENEIKTLLNQREQPIDSPLDHMLLRNFADVSIRLDFEHIYNHIFSSQIALLKRANTIGQLTKQDIEKHFEYCKTVATYPKDWDANHYAAFLFRSILMRTDDDVSRITVKGQEFLVWLARTGYTETPNGF